MDRCYQYFNCHNPKCKIYNTEDEKQCWEVEGTLCSSHLLEETLKVVGNKKDIFAGSMYFQFVKQLRT